MPDGPYLFKLYRNRRDFFEAGMDNIPGCYILCSKQDEPLYIGKSKSVLHRVYTHWIDQRDGHGKQWRMAGNAEWYIQKPFAPPEAYLRIWYSDEIDEFEKQLIYHLNPRFNSKRYAYVR